MNKLKDGIAGFNNTEALLASTVRRLGSPVSTILLQTPCQVFSTPEVEGVIGYQRINNCAVAIGDPICLPEHAARLTHAFHTFCQMHDLKMIFFLASESYAHWAINNGSHILIQVAEELIINPVNFKTDQNLKGKIKKSIRHGTIVKEYMSDDPALENQMKTLFETWKKSRRGPQIYLGTFTITGAHKRIFYASQNGKMVGLLVLSLVDRFQGWAAGTFLALADAPRGTTEHLMSSAIETLANENCHYCCLGIASGSKLGEIVGLSPLSKFFVHLIFQISKWYFRLYARTIYLYKYHPSSSRKYLILNEKLKWEELMAIKQVLNVKL